MPQEKIFRLGKRFHKYKAITQALVSAAVIMFYILYCIVLLPAVPWLSEQILFVIFVGLEALFMWAIQKAGKLICIRFYYVVDRQALTIVSGEKKDVLRWEDFTRAELARFDYTSICPVEYTVQGKKLTLNQYLEDLWGINREICDHIRDHVVISEELDKKIHILSY